MGNPCLETMKNLEDAIHDSTVDALIYDPTVDELSNKVDLRRLADKLDMPINRRDERDILSFLIYEAYHIGREAAYIDYVENAA